MMSGRARILLFGVLWGLIETPLAVAGGALTVEISRVIAFVDLKNMFLLRLVLLLFIVVSLVLGYFVEDAEEVAKSFPISQIVPIATILLVPASALGYGVDSGFAKLMVVFNAAQWLALLGVFGLIGAIVGSFLGEYGGARRKARRMRPLPPVGEQFA